MRDPFISRIESYVTELSAPDVSTQNSCLIFNSLFREDETTTLSRNVGIRSPLYVASLPRSMESSHHRYEGFKK